MELSFEFDDLDGLSLPKAQKKFRLAVEPCNLCLEGRENEQAEPEGRMSDCSSALPLYH